MGGKLNGINPNRILIIGRKYNKYQMEFSLSPDLWGLKKVQNYFQFLKKTPNKSGRYSKNFKLFPYYTNKRDPFFYHYL